MSRHTHYETLHWFLLTGSSSRSLDNTGGVLSPSDAPTWPDPEKFWLSLCFQSSGVPVQAVKPRDTASDSEGLSVSFQVGCHSCIWCFPSLCWHCPRLQRSAAPWWCWAGAVPVTFWRGFPSAASQCSTCLGQSGCPKLLQCS